ncbi:unnamed protein product [Laminaria digitata]
MRSFFRARFIQQREGFASNAEQGVFGEIVKVLLIVCWATGKWLTGHLPKLSLITLSPPWNGEVIQDDRICGLPCHQPRRFQFLGIQKYFCRFDMGKFNFYQKRLIVGGW